MSLDPEQMRALLARANKWRRKGKSIAQIDAVLEGVTYRDLVKLAGSHKLDVQPERVPPPIRTRDLLRSGGQGLTLRFLDELAGVGAAMVPGGKNYTQARDEVRVNDANFRADHPTADALANIYGALPAALVTGAATAPMAGAGMAGRVATSVGTGALFGGVAGAGDAETMSEVPMEAAKGAVGGAVLGGGAGLLAEGASAVAPMARRALGAVAPKTAGELTAGADVATRAASAGTTPEKFVLNQNTGIVADLRELTGFPGPADAAKEAAMRKLAAVGKQLFAPLDQAYPVLASKELDDVVTHPAVEGIWKNIVGKRVKGQQGFPEYQTLWRRLENEVKKLRKSGDTDLAREVGELRESLTEAIEDVAPGFRAATRGYAKTATTVSAFDLGARAYTKKLGGRAVSRQLVDIARKAGSEAQAAIEAYRHGMVDEMSRAIARAPRTNNVGQSIVRMGKDRIDALRILFPEPGSFETFMAQAAERGQLTALQNATLAAAQPAAAEAGSGWRSIVKKQFAPSDAYQSARSGALESAFRRGVPPNAYPRYMQFMNAVPDASAVGAAPVGGGMSPQLLDELLGKNQ